MKALLAALPLAVMIVPANAQTGSHYSIGRMLGLEEPGLTSLSPDGRVIVLERRAPRDRSGTADGTRLFVADTTAPDVLKPLFQQVSGSSYTLGYFSPDGRYISYQRRAPGVYALGVFDFRTGESREFAPSIEDLGGGNPWISDHLLATRTAPPGQLAYSVERAAESLDRLHAAWGDRRRGIKDTSSPIGSGRYSAIDARVPQEGGLAILDARTGVSRELSRGEYQFWSASPDGTMIAAAQLRRGVIDPGTSDADTRPSRRTLVIFDVATGRRTEVAPELDLNRVGAPEWTHDGRSVMFHVPGRGPNGTITAALWRWDRASGKVTRVAPAELELVPDSWLKRPSMALLEGDPVVLATMRTAGPASRGWYRLAPGKAPQLLTAAFGSAQPEMLGTSGDALVAVAGGQIWKVRADGTRSLLSSTQGTLSPWRTPLINGSQPLTPLVAPVLSRSWLIDRATIATAGKFIELDTATGATKTITLPTSSRVYSAAGQRIAYTVEDRGASRLAIAAMGDDGPARTVIALNEALSDITPFKTVPIAHTLADGTELTSYLMLPRDYRPGQRLPIIASIYPGTVYKRPPNKPLNWVDFNNPNVWADYGYGYLSVSVPRSRTVPRDPAKDLAPMVLTAIDAAIAKGYADPDRLALEGHSFGGWGTLMTISQTDRFKVAITYAAVTDQITRYGTFDRLDRMTAPAVKATFDLVTMNDDESSQFGLGAPPWVVPQRYIDASPLFQVEKINTPVMLVQGDLDYVPIEQGEEMFTALRRLNKDALFVRYWGEWHTISSGANIRDLYARRLAWYDEHLDLKRDAQGQILWAGDKPASRNGAAPHDRDWFLALDALRTKQGAR